MSILKAASKAVRDNAREKYMVLEGANNEKIVRTNGEKFTDSFGNRFTWSNKEKSWELVETEKTDKRIKKKDDNPVMWFVLAIAAIFLIRK